MPNIIVINHDSPTTVRSPVTSHVRVDYGAAVQVVTKGPEVSRVTVAPGRAGAPGPAGSFYTHIQSAPGATWIIVHGLHRRPVVSVVLDGDPHVIYADISYPDLDTVSIEFPEPCTGIAEM